MYLFYLPLIPCLLLGQYQTHPSIHIFHTHLEGCCHQQLTNRSCLAQSPSLCSICFSFCVSWLRVWPRLTPAPPSLFLKSYSMTLGDEDLFFFFFLQSLTFSLFCHHGDQSSCYETRCHVWVWNRVHERCLCASALSLSESHASYVWRRMMQAGKYGMFRCRFPRLLGQPVCTWWRTPSWKIRGSFRFPRLITVMFYVIN